jgi:hypothetical protein
MPVPGAAVAAPSCHACCMRHSKEFGTGWLRVAAGPLYVLDMSHPERCMVRGELPAARLLPWNMHGWFVGTRQRADAPPPQGMGSLLIAIRWLGAAVCCMGGMVSVFSIAKQGP